MTTKTALEVPTGMERIYRRFERWRSSHRGRLPIPKALWASAANSPAPGLALFLRKGMTAWMRAWSPYTPNAAPEMALPPSANQSSPPDIRAQLTALLAGMILGQHLEIIT